MNKYKIELTDQAVFDLEHIQERIMDDYSEDTAIKAIRKIIRSYSKLEDFPKSGIPVHKEFWTTDKELFLLRLWKDTLIYRFDGSLVTIIAVISNREDLARKINKYI